MARQAWKNQGFFETFRNEGLAHWNRSVLELTLQKKLDSVSLVKPGFFGNLRNYWVANIQKKLGSLSLEIPGFHGKFGNEHVAQWNRWALKLTLLGKHGSKSVVNPGFLGKLGNDRMAQQNPRTPEL